MISPPKPTVFHNFLVLIHRESKKTGFDRSPVFLLSLWISTRKLWKTVSFGGEIIRRSFVLLSRIAYISGHDVAQIPHIPFLDNVRLICLKMVDIRYQELSDGSSTGFSAMDTAIDHRYGTTDRAALLCRVQTALMHISTAPTTTTINNRQ